LLIERRQFPFGFAPPAGHVDDGETYIDAACRELQEEVGLEAPLLFRVPNVGRFGRPRPARKSRDKPQVERPMLDVRDSFWRGREFASLEAMRVAALRWCTEVAGARSCRPLDGAAPAAVLTAELWLEPPST
jgi:8-oxo-dGTP pyrophosphatase MutT (NUDIX family)